MDDMKIDASIEHVTLPLDNDASMQFTGRQFAGGAWYDEETDTLTRQNLYVTEENEHIYSIITGNKDTRTRRAYRVSLQGEHCVINDGHNEMHVELEMLMLAVRALTGLDKNATPTLEIIEETLRAANS